MAVAVAIGAALAGCGGQPIDPAKQGVAAVTTAKPGEAATAPAHPAPQAAIPPPRPKVNDDPDQLIGMDNGGLRRLLGAPHFVRRDTAAELWRYRNGGCILDLFLYSGRAGGGDGLGVLYYEARSLSHTRITARGCLRALLRAHAGRKAG